MRGNGTWASRGRGWLILMCVTLSFALLIEPIMVSAGQRGKNQPNPVPQRAWKLAFQDEFEGASLNEQVWATEFPWGRERCSVGELQWYAPNVFTVANSKLQISAQPMLPKECPQPSSQPMSYSSGLISSHKSFATQYGRFEIRCKIPRGKGLWPAFWLLPTDTSWPPEIDVFETIGTTTNTVHMTTHWGTSNDHHSDGMEFVGPDFSDGFHTFAMEWSETSIVWFVDGVERHRVENRSPQVPMYMVANLAVGGNWPGYPDATTNFPSTFEIDYIRAYSSEVAPSAQPVKDKKDKGKNNDKKRKKKKRKNRIARLNGAIP